MNKVIQELYNHFRSNPDGVWIMQVQNIEHLIEVLVKNDIKRVLDLGTGIGFTTALCALILKSKKVDYQIDTIEQYDKCINLAKIIIPEPLKEKVNFLKSEVEVWQSSKIPYYNFSIYKNMPETLDYDLIINDGPAGFLGDNCFIDLDNGTILKELENKRLKKDTIIVYDGRINSLKFLDRYYNDNFIAIPPLNKNRFNVLKVINEEPQYRDNHLKVMEQLGFMKNL